MERIIKIVLKYKHFKGDTYIVTNIAYDSENLSKKVVYENIKTNKVWVRDYRMFNSLVDKEKYPNIDQKYRFEEVVE